MAFFRGDERTRTFIVKTWDEDGTREKNTFTSSGKTQDFESFHVGAEGAVKLQIIPASPNALDWLSIYEARFFML